MNSATKLALAVRATVMFIVCSALAFSITMGGAELWWGFRVAVAFALAFTWDRIVFLNFIWQENGDLGQPDDVA